MIEKNMKINDFVKILEAVRDKRPYSLNYVLLEDGRLHEFVKRNGIEELLSLFYDLQDSKPANFN